MQTKLAMFEYVFASSFHNAFLHDLTQKIVRPLLATANIIM
jgi:hypothetical protein